MNRISFGVDIGGINTVVGVLNEQGDLLAEGGISTKKYPHLSDYPTYVADLAAEMRRLLEGIDGEYELVGVGIGAPNANYHSGNIETPANLWKFTDDESNPDESRRMFALCDDLRREMPELPLAVITNDANAATIGEMLYGNGRGLRDFMMVTLGTGLGSGFVANGDLIYGHDGFAGEMGHMIVVPDGRECGCGHKGCLETYASATGIRRTAFEMMAKSRLDSPLREYSFNELDSAMISKHALEGDTLSLEIFRYTGEILGRAIASVVTITSPKAVILFGGLAKAGELIFAPTREAMESNLLFFYKGNVDLLPSGITDRNIAILGAAALVWQEVSK